MSKLQECEKTTAEWILTLKNAHLFQDMSEEQLLAISNYMQVEFFESETIVFHEGEVGEKIYFQLDGQSNLFLGPKDNSTILVHGAIGDCFGEMAVIDDKPRSASLQTTTPTHFLVIDKSSFEKLLSMGHSCFSLNLMRFLSQRLRQTDQLLIDLLQKENIKLESTLNLLKEAQDELIQKERLSTLGRMASMIVHDLKNPLTSITTMSYVLTHQDLTSDQRKNYGQMLDKEIHRLIDMIEEILLFAKDDSDLYMQPLDLNKLMQELPEKIGETLLEGIDMQIKPFEGERFFLDYNRIQRALLNLLKNACEAVQSQSNPQLSMEVISKESFIEFNIVDNGSGIPESIRNSLFDAFVSSGKAHGIGLGLAIVKKVAEDHNGNVSFETSSNGTQFKISIPQRSSLQEDK